MRTTLIITALVLCASSQAWAIRVASEVAPGAVAPQPATPPSASAASQADDSSSLREGTITSVSTARDRIEVNGSWLKLAAAKTRIFQRGQAVNGDVLAKGQTVKFTLMPGDTERATLGVIYVP